MAVDLLAAEDETGIHDAPKNPAPHYRRWVVGIVAFALFAATLGYLTGNEVQANTQFDETHASLNVTRHHNSVVLADLAAVRHDLTVVDSQVGQSTIALSRDTTQLEDVQAALTNAVADVSHQSQTISIDRSKGGCANPSITVLSGTG
jgi:hypothetical protein